MDSKKILKVYGPYTSKKDVRKRVVFYFDDKSTSTTSYARFIYEQENGKFDTALTVDHIDEDFANDIIENLQPLTRIENIQKAWQTDKNKPKEWFEGVCQICDIKFIKPMRDVKHNQLKQKKSGPFCSRKCAGTYNARK